MEATILAGYLAALGHHHQVDKAGRPYVEHVRRVAERAGEAAQSNPGSRVSPPDAIAVGLLHDLIEDTPATSQMLLDLGVPSAVVEAVVALTRRPDETYMQFVVRVGEDPLARVVKIADIEDHLQPRADGYTLPDSMRAKYQRALDMLHNK